jgi:hypothetical protein
LTLKLLAVGKLATRYADQDGSGARKIDDKIEHGHVRLLLFAILP